MILAWLLLLTGLTISAVAIYYSVVGLAAIFSAAVIPIIVMGSALEVAKLVCASWLKANWERAPRFLKLYMTTAVVVLMLITSMGIFGFLSKAHNDQNLVSGDVQSKIAIFDEQIKTEKENIESNRKQLRQMDDAVDQVMARSTTEGGANNANNIRTRQLKDRQRIAAEITASQKKIAALNEQRAPVAAEIRKVEAEVGPLKYIAKFIYGEKGADENMLEKAVTWVIILIVIVFDPLAVIMLLAAQMTFGWKKENEEDEYLLHETVPHDSWVADVGEKPTKQELTEIEQTHTEETIPANEPSTALGGDITAPEEQQQQEDPVEQWNKMIAEAEKAVEDEKESTVEERVAKGETYIDGEGNEIPTDTPKTLKLSDVLGEPDQGDSKKKTYMTKDQTGSVQVKTRE